ncbi:hypothetical protein [Candidatus Accumulibacter sp. ACC007]|uniref:hypothetical protein n=1 Tax=Candidatus Accumulibacter sp. ACC007 TaxID=2823333 RepID=UPI0025BEAC10|nr:hypothetical protein [Candidatus Accumulibacter sp. ACC007]
MGDDQRARCGQDRDHGESRHHREKIRLALLEEYRLTLKSDAKAGTTLTHQSSASIGRRSVHRYEASRDEILQWADCAMYEAKQAGRNFIRFHDGGQRG